MLSENESAHEMVYKIEALEEKNQKIRQELEAANLQIRNFKSVGGGRDSKGNSNDAEMIEELKILN